MNKQQIKISDKLLSRWIADGQFIAKYYEKKILKFSVDSVSSLDWQTKELHEIFLKNIFKNINLKLVNSILDVGCGNCDIIDYFKFKSKNFLWYEGIDVVEKFINNAKKKHSKRGVVIKKVNFLAINYWPNRKSDLVINLGGLNSLVSYRYNYLKYSIEKMILVSRRYVAFNLIIQVDDDYFKKSKKRKVGSIASFEESKLISILKKLSQDYNISWKIEKVSIFKGSVDAFVLIELL